MDTGLWPGRSAWTATADSPSPGFSHTRPRFTPLSLQGLFLSPETLPSLSTVTPTSHEIPVRLLRHQGALPLPPSLLTLPSLPHCTVPAPGPARGEAELRPALAAAPGPRRAGLRPRRRTSPRHHLHSAVRVAGAHSAGTIRRKSAHAGYTDTDQVAEQLKPQTARVRGRKGTGAPPLRAACTVLV